MVGMGKGMNRRVNNVYSAVRKMSAISGQTDEESLMQLAMSTKHGQNLSQVLLKRGLEVQDLPLPGQRLGVGGKVTQNSTSIAR